MEMMCSFVFKACAETKSKPSFLLDKNLESTLRQIQKKFPAVDKVKKNFFINIYSIFVFLESISNTYIY